MSVLNFQEQPGFRLMQGEDINSIIDAVNGLASGTESFTKITFDSNVPATTLLLGAGSTSTRYNMGTTAGTQMFGFFGETTNTTGSNRVINSRLYFGAAGEGEVIRAMAVANNATVANGGTVNGGHFTFSASGASAAVSGAANALRATLAIGASAAPGGTLASLQLDSDLDNAGTVPATAAYIRCSNSNTKKIDNLIAFDASPSTTLYATSGTSAGSAGDTSKCNAPKVLKCLVGGSDVYIPVFTQNS